MLRSFCASFSPCLDIVVVVAVCPGLPFLNGIEVTYARGRPRRWLQAAPGGEPWGFSFPFCFFPTAPFAPFATGTGSASSKESQLSLARGLTTCGILYVFFFCALFCFCYSYAGWDEFGKIANANPFRTRIESCIYIEIQPHRDENPEKGAAGLLGGSCGQFRWEGKEWILWVSVGKERRMASIPETKRTVKMHIFLHQQVFCFVLRAPTVGFGGWSGLMEKGLLLTNL